MTLKPNDILYTRDGRKSGNIIVIDVIDCEYHIGGDPDCSISYQILWGISDYGNQVRWRIGPNLWKQFYKTLGHATPTHKYYDYKLNHPEELI